MKNLKKKKKIKDEIQILGHATMQKENEVEITMEVNNQNRLKQADKVLKDNIKKEIKVLEDNIPYTKKEKKAPKRLIHPKDKTKQIHLKYKEVEFVTKTPMHPRDRLKRNLKNRLMSKESKESEIKFVKPMHP